jgi:lysozyme family protein
MTPTERSLIEHIIDEREKGFVDRKDDKGGPTNWGVTQKTLSRARGHAVTVQNVKDLTREEAIQIYYELYMLPLGFSMVQHAPLYDLVMDCAIHHGLTGASRLVQRALDVTVDGVVGPKTRAAIIAMDPKRLYALVLGQRVRLFGRLISNDWSDDDHDGKPDAAENAEGWLNRTAEFVERG